MFNELKQLRDYYKNLVDADQVINSAPVSPFPDIRKRFQVQTNAEEVYSRMFHRDVIPEGKTAAFDWNEAVGVAVNDDLENVEDIFFNVKQTDQGEIVESNALPTDSKFPAYALKGRHKKYEKSFDAAMQYISRPVCTLEEYIDFHGDRGIREGRVEIHNKEQGKGAVFYAHILNYRDGPGIDPSTDIGVAGDPGADSRSDWTVRLQRYRTKILSSVNPHKA